MNIEKARFNMIEQQIKPWMVFDERLLDVMAIIAREDFVPTTHRNLAYADIDIPLGHNQVMLAPRELARMIQALKLTGEEKILEIGCGSGYATVLLSKLAKKIFSVDIISDFVKNTQKKLKQLTINNVVVEEVDASDGWLAHAPYDAILITSAISKLTESMKRSLNPNGRIVAVLGEEGAYTVNLCQLDKDNQWTYELLFPIDTKRMINSAHPNKFSF